MIKIRNKKLMLLLGAVLAVFAVGLLTACREREIPAGWRATDLPTPAPLQINTAVTAIDATPNTGIVFLYSQQ